MNEGEGDLRFGCAVLVLGAAVVTLVAVRSTDSRFVWWIGFFLSLGYLSVLVHLILDEFRL